MTLIRTAAPVSHGRRATLPHDLPASPRRRPRRAQRDAERGAVSEADWHRPVLRRSLGASHIVMLALLVVWGIGPLLLLVKFAVTPTQGWDGLIGLTVYRGAIRMVREAAARGHELLFALLDRLEAIA